MTRWLTPPQIARERQIRVGKVLGWIRSGELAAVNCAARPHGRPRWRVSAEALAKFDSARSNRRELPQEVRRSQRRHEEVTQYF